MTEEDIMKSLEICHGSNCLGCPLKKRVDCRAHLARETLSLLKQKNATIEQTAFELTVAKDNLDDARFQLAKSEDTNKRLRQTMADVVKSHKQIVKDLMEERNKE